MLPKSSPKKAPAFKGLGPDERKRFGRLPAPSSTPNLLRHVGTSPTVAEATLSKRPDPFDATRFESAILELWCMTLEDRAKRDIANPRIETMRLATPNGFPLRARDRFFSSIVVPRYWS